jgi:Ca-activated chloride channel family protein
MNPTLTDPSTAAGLTDGALQFLSPERLLLLLAVAALAIGYLVIGRRRSRYALRFSSVELFDGVAPDRPGWRRHLPAAMVLAGLATLVIGTARPALAEEIPAEMATVIVALDSSLSMKAKDVNPHRLAAAQDAADRFLDLVPPTVRVGLVTFDAQARVAMAPTTDRIALRRAIDRIKLGEGTAIGEAIFTSLEELQADGEDVPGGIVLLSDGETTAGRSGREAAEEAASRSVPVTTIAFGTPGGTVTIGGQTIPVPADREALRSIAERTGGQSFDAFTADEVVKVFEQLGSQIGTTFEQHEIGDRFAGLALGLLLAAGLGSLFWFARLP